MFGPVNSRAWRRLAGPCLIAAGGARWSTAAGGVLRPAGPGGWWGAAAGDLLALAGE